jgi:hypothetical protein
MPNTPDITQVFSTKNLSGNFSISLPSGFYFATMQAADPNAASPVLTITQGGPTGPVLATLNTSLAATNQFAPSVTLAAVQFYGLGEAQFQTDGSAVNLNVAGGTAAQICIYG